MKAHRPLIMTHRGLVVAGHHTAAEAGAQVLRSGGNAMDAAVTAAAVLTVAIPHMNGIGGDAFALWFDARRNETIAINGSGGAPAAADLDSYRGRGLDNVPRRGPLSISIPGTVAAWADALEKCGTISLTQALAPAIELAEKGVPLDWNLCEFLNGEVYAGLVGDYPALETLFGPPGNRRLGELLPLGPLAQTLRSLAGFGPETLYGGPLGEALCADLKAAGALVTPDDLAAHETIFQTPLAISFRGYRVVVPPPNTQGLALVTLLGLLQAEDKSRAATDESALVRFLRLKHAAFAQRDRYLGDPAVARIPPDLLTQDGLSALADDSASYAPPNLGATDQPAGGDTTCLVAMDRMGNTVSWVQSLFEEFGSGIASPSTGIVLHNRLSLATMLPDTPNTLAPGHRPFHTLCPALFLRDGACRLAAATPGDHGQPQTIAQVALSLFDYGMDVQAAVEAPRIRHDRGFDVMHESRCDPALLRPLEALGYRLNDVGPWARLMGGINAIHCPEDELRMAGADPRRSSYAVVE